MDTEDCLSTGMKLSVLAKSTGNGLTVVLEARASGRFSKFCAEVEPRRADGPVFSETDEDQRAPGRSVVRLA